MSPASGHLPLFRTAQANRLALVAQVAFGIYLASMFLWPSWFVATLVLAIYTWTPFAARREERRRSASLHQAAESERGVNSVEHDANPYSPPRTLT